MNPSLAERLRWNAAGWSSGVATRDSAMIARFGAYMYAGGGTLALVLLAAPHAGSTSEPGLALIAVIAYVVAAVHVIVFDRLRAWAFQAFMALGTVMITIGALLYGEPTDAIVVLYATVAVAAFYSWGRTLAGLQLVVIAIAYGAVLVWEESFGAAVRPWLLAVGLILVLGIVVGQVGDRMEWLADRLVHAARTDPLTDLLNRRGFEERFDVELERARRNEDHLSVLIADLDHFKEVNDRLGHQAGDEALQHLSTLLMDRKRLIDTAARMGGEEFALILPGSDEHGAYVLAERMRGVVKRAFADQPVPLTLSFGIASFPTHGKTGEPLLHAADQALYAAKTLGRDRSVIHTDEVARVVASVDRRDNQREGHLATLLALAETLDVRDMGTARHSRTVGRYAELAARGLGLAPETVERVRIAGILHDVGKVGVPDSVLRKPGPLSANEWGVMKKHAEVGARILEGSDLVDIRTWVLAHQERPDGRGYPHGLKGQEIPLEARILAVADAYEAMTSLRVYRLPLSPEAAKAELLRNAGEQFDGRVVEAFLRLVEREGNKATSGTTT